MRKWVICLAIGIGMLAFGSGVGGNDSQIRCGSEVMLPGDICEETRGGVTVDTKTYDEMKASKEAGQRTFNSWGRWALLGGGVVLVGLGVFGIVRVRRSRRSTPAPAQQPPFPQQPQFAQQTPYAQQPQPQRYPQQPFQQLPHPQQYGQQPPQNYGPPQNFGPGQY